MNIKGISAFILGVLAGFAIWLFSEHISGQKEAFDAFGYYLPALLLVGIVLFFRPAYAFIGIITGQLLFLFQTASGPFWPIGLTVILVCSLFSFLTAIVTRKIYSETLKTKIERT